MSRSRNISQEQANMAVATALQRQVVDLERQIEAALVQINDLTAIKNGLISGQMKLQRQLAEAKRLDELQRGLIVKQAAEIVSLKKYFFMHENWRLGTGLCKRAEDNEAALFSSVDLLEEKQAEIEAMRPMVEACKVHYDSHNYKEIPLCYCQICQWYRDYLDRKQPWPQPNQSFSQSVCLQ